MPRNFGEDMNFINEMSLFLNDRPLLTSFLGSLLAGVVLLGTAPFWLKHVNTELIGPVTKVVLAGVGVAVVVILIDWLVNRVASGMRYELVPPENSSSEEIDTIRLSCNLEAERVYPMVDGSYVTNRARSEASASRQRYFQGCLQREGFSLRLIEPPGSEDPQ